MTISFVFDHGEQFATIFGILSVYLLTVGDGRGWSLGILWALLSGSVFWREKIYGTAFLHIYFLAAQVVGWKRWRDGQEKDLRRRSRRMTQRARLFSLAVFLSSCLVAGYALQIWGGKLYWLDSFATIGSVMAQFFTVLGYWECWPLWLAVNLVYVALNAHQGLWAFVLLYSVFCLLSLNGWREWTRDREQGHRKSRSSYGNRPEI